MCRQDVLFDRVMAICKTFVVAAALVFSAAAQADTLSFSTTVTTEASDQALVAHVTVELQGPSALYNVEMRLLTQNQSMPTAKRGYWPPGLAINKSVAIPQPHRFSGDYPLLVEITAQDAAGVWTSVALASIYQFNFPAGERPVSEHLPAVELLGDEIVWHLNGVDASTVRAITTNAPLWRRTGFELTPAQTTLDFVYDSSRPPLPRYVLRQQFALSWLENNVHKTRTIPWAMIVDADGKWQATTDPQRAQTRPPAPFWHNELFLYALALLVIVFVIARGGFRKGDVAANASRVALFWSITVVLGLTAWAISHANFSLWFIPTHVTGGDTGSHVFYAHKFIEWFFSGKISAWLPEGFAGYPAFSYYFPLPFSLMALLSLVIDTNVAIKIIAMSPAFLLPVATYVFGASLHWTLAQRLLAAVASITFIFSTETTFWGGNLPAQLAGEFAYSWGMVFVLLFWSALAIGLRRNGIGWLMLAVVMEACVALSHGYALLVAGFGAFAFLFGIGGGWRSLAKIAGVHVLAFLLIGFWLIPLMATLPWTVPNDASVGAWDWHILWSRSSWPLLVGVFALPLLYRQNAESRITLMFLLGIVLLSYTGFMLGHRFGLAEVRFFPYAQWAAVVLAAVAIGSMISSRKHALWWAAGMSIACAGWVTQNAKIIDDWTRWNLSGYEAKPMWPVYQALARASSGGLHEPRVLFEHDPANNDLGSTRTLEALPLFGSRPVLEGLHMESALSAPFIYQIQADISALPSGPLSRYPSSTSSVDKAVARLQEFYTDTLILRSEAMKQRFRADDRFDVVLDQPPFLVLKLKQLTTQLIDVVDVPVMSQQDSHWLDSAFRRFVVEFPYTQRWVFNAKEQAAFRQLNPDVKTSVKLLEFDREKIVFETNAVGVPHIIRMSYHPRWKSAGGEEIALIEPSFMMIVPTSSRVELSYAAGWGNYLGWLFTLLALPGATLFYKAMPRLSVDTAASLVARQWFVLVMIIMPLAIWMLWRSDAETRYSYAHELVRAEKFLEAAPILESTVASRVARARQAESLFWAARSYEWGGQTASAKPIYQRLYVDYPESYWWPETAYRLASIAKMETRPQEIETILTTMDRYYPEHRWTVLAKTDLSR